MFAPMRSPHWMNLNRLSLTESDYGDYSYRRGAADFEIPIGILGLMCALW